MSNAIDLDRDPACEAGEIEHQMADRMLAAEFMPARPLAQLAPEQDFGQVARPAFALGDFEGVVVCAKNPSTSLRLVPLPVPGRF